MTDANGHAGDLDMQPVGVTYYDKTSDKDPEGITRQTLSIARKRGKELGIEHFVVASSTGLVARMASAELAGRTAVVVGEDRSWYDKALLEELQSKKVPVLFSREIPYSYPSDVQTALRRFCEGAKVCPEVVMLAADNDAVPAGREVMAMAGTGSGADTAMVIVSARSKDFGQLRIRELVCKPR